MAKTKNSGFMLDDRDTDPYGVMKMRENANQAKKSKSGNASKKSNKGKR